MSTVPALNLAPPPEDTAPLPSNIEAEQALLGAVLYDNDAFQFAEDLEARHFYEPFHQRIWALMTERIGRGDLVEPIWVSEKCAADPAFAEMGGVGYLADLIDRAPPAATARHCAEMVSEAYIRREIVRIGRDAEVQACDPSEPAPACLEAVETALFELAEDKKREGGFADFSEAVDGALEMAAAAYKRDGSVAGLATGLIDLDRKLGGLHRSDLIILAGRPSMGKTALATNIGYAAAKAGASVGFFSLEMGREQLAMRLLADVSGVSSDRIRRGDIDSTDYGRLHDAGAEIRALPLHIDATGALPIHKLAGRARRLKRRKGLDLVIVDYLQLIAGTDQGRRNGRVQEVSEITQALKAMAKELDVPVLALSQLSRKVEDRDDKRPQLADLRDSGSIEQDADVVMFVFREAYYLARLEPKPDTPEYQQWQEDVDRVRHLAEVIIGKQRHGPIGTVKLHFNEDLTRFSNLAREGRFMTGARLPYGDDR